MFRRTLNAINLCVRYCSSHASTSSSSANFTDNYHYADSYNSTDCNIIEDTQVNSILFFSFNNINNILRIKFNNFI